MNRYTVLGAIQGEPMHQGLIHVKAENAAEAVVRVVAGHLRGGTDEESLQRARDSTTLHNDLGIQVLAVLDDWVWIVGGDMAPEGVRELRPAGLTLYFDDHGVGAEALRQMALRCIEKQCHVGVDIDGREHSVLGYPHAIDPTVPPTWLDLRLLGHADVVIERLTIADITEVRL